MDIFAAFDTLPFLVCNSWLGQQTLSPDEQRHLSPCLLVSNGLCLLVSNGPGEVSWLGQQTLTTTTKLHKEDGANLN
jgi:hypothetical protein